VPRLYLSQAELNASPIAIGLSGFLATASAQTIMTTLFRASARVDAFCHRRIGLPGVTTVDVAGASSGSTVLAVASLLGFDNRDEQAVFVGSGATLELVPVVAGGVQIASYVSPFNGSLQLATPLQFTHFAGEPVVGVYYEVREMGSSSSTDVYAEAFLTQQAQMAQAHAPMIARGMGFLARTVFLRNYPIASIKNVEASYSYENEYFQLDATAVSLEPNAGYYNLPLGSPVLEGSYVRTTYTGGYAVVPDEVKEAAMYYAADEFTLLNTNYAQMYTRITQGKRTVQMANPNARGKSMFEQRAENILMDGGFKPLF
jgi:hypothetical protein